MVGQCKKWEGCICCKVFSWLSCLSYGSNNVGRQCNKWEEIRSFLMDQPFNMQSSHGYSCNSCKFNFFNHRNISLYSSFTICFLVFEMLNFVVKIYPLSCLYYYFYFLSIVFWVYNFGVFSYYFIELCLLFAAKMRF